MVSKFVLNTEVLDLFSEDDVEINLCITAGLLQRIEDRAAKIKVDAVPRDLAVKYRIV